MARLIPKEDGMKVMWKNTAWVNRWTLLSEVEEVVRESGVIFTLREKKMRVSSWRYESVERFLALKNWIQDCFECIL